MYQKTTVESEPNKPSILLRSVKRDPVVSPNPHQKTGILFESLSETKCPHCNAAVPLAESRPLTNVLCPSCGGKLLVPGRVGGFFLHKHIGEGEMGAIYLATDESLNREVAVKLVRGCHADNPESCERLRREACAAGKLNHPRVAQVYALNFSNGHPYLVMELVTGQDFSQKLESEGRIEERVVLRMALDVADGLSALHREGLAHGDIKPGNIVLDRDGNAKLVDFGLSGMTRLDSSGALVGTPNYIAPELLRGAADTHRSDLFSLGATLYHLLSGRAPIEGEKTIDVLKAKLLRRPIPLGRFARHVSQPTRKLIMQMLEPDPEKRQTDSDVVAAELRGALAQLDTPAPAAPVASSESARRLFPSLGWPLQTRCARTPLSRRRDVVTVALGLVAILEILIAVRQQSFYQTWEWLSQQMSGHLMTAAPQASPTQPDSASPAREEDGHMEPVDLSASPPPAVVATPDPTGYPLSETAGPANRPLRENAASTNAVIAKDIKPLWQSMNLGDRTLSGSTIQMGETMIIQGSGSDMWKGDDRCRFVWMKVSNSYAFSAQVKAIANTSSFAVTGLLVKGDDPALGPGLLFGFLGNGELFFQARQPNNKSVVVKRSGQPALLPSHLKVVRRGNRFEACVSSDGRSWETFAAYDQELPAVNTIGFAVSSHVSNTLATAKFANIRVLMPGQPGATQNTKAPAVTRKPSGAARK
jgi:serine/threonine-protein kinase